MGLTPVFRAVHLRSRTNPRITLCQEWMMRTEGFDHLALVGLDGKPSARFADLAGWDRDEAIRTVLFCAWMSDSDFEARAQMRDDLDCRGCLEVAHA